jgi:succinate dehydrogenase / fumarate reductase flavoprotein subunit
VFLDIASRRSAEDIRKRLPSMYHQFMELAGVDITREAMEVGPTLHYIMGGVRVEPDSGSTSVPGLFAAGEVSGGMHGANRLGGNSLSDLLVFGRRAGMGAADYVEGGGGNDAKVDDLLVQHYMDEALEPFTREEGENPYTLQHDLQEMMQANVGIIRNGPELDEAIEQLEVLKERVQNIAVKGGRAYNPGWNLATDLPAMLTVSTCVALGARDRKESRGGQTREDFPKADPELGKVNFVQSQPSGGGFNGEIKIVPEPLPVMPDDLRALLEEAPK